MPIWGSILVIFVLFVLGGIFSAAEMALVSLREAQIEQLGSRGARGKAVKELTSNPNRFLSAVQIGVTLAGFLSSAFGTDSLAGAWVAPAFRGWGMSSGLASVLAVIVVTAAISFFSIVISELFSKRLALQRPETVALALAPIVNGLAKVFRPVIWALGASTNLLVRLVGFDPNAGKEGVSDEELRSMVVNAHSLGAEEKHIVDEVFSAGDRSLREVMVPRTEVDFLPGDMAVDQAIREVQGAPHSRYPVIDNSPDKVLGFLHVRDLMGVGPTPRRTPIAKLVRPVLSLPETVRVPRALTDMRRAHSHLAIVLDEYGGTAGLVTLEDLVEELIGDITDEYDVEDDNTRKHRQLSEIDGLTTLEDFGDITDHVIPEGPYDTVAGFFMTECGEVPSVGDSISVSLLSRQEADDEGDDAEGGGDDYELSVTQMDGRRIAWLRLRALPAGSVAAQHDPDAQHDPAVEDDQVAQGNEPATKLPVDADPNTVARFADTLARNKVASATARPEAPATDAPDSSSMPAGGTDTEAPNGDQT